MIVSRRHIAAIQKARATLYQIQDAASREHYPDGRLYEACEAAERDLLSVLAIAQVYNLGAVDSLSLYDNQEGLPAS